MNIYAQKMLISLRISQQLIENLIFIFCMFFRLFIILGKKKLLEQSRSNSLLSKDGYPMAYNIAEKVYN